MSEGDISNEKCETAKFGGVVESEGGEVVGIDKRDGLDRSFVRDEADVL